jgi:hypothetical protein
MVPWHFRDLERTQGTGLTSADPADDIRRNQAGGKTKECQGKSRETPCFFTFLIQGKKIIGLVDFIKASFPAGKPLRLVTWLRSVTGLLNDIHTIMNSQRPWGIEFDKSTIF